MCAKKVAWVGINSDPACFLSVRHCYSVLISQYREIKMLPHAQIQNSLEHPQFRLCSTSGCRWHRYRRGWTLRVDDTVTSLLDHNLLMILKKCPLQIISDLSVSIYLCPEPSSNHHFSPVNTVIMHGQYMDCNILYCATLWPCDYSLLQRSDLDQIVKIRNPKHSKTRVTTSFV